MRKLTLAISTAALALSGTAMAQTAPAAPVKARAPMAEMTRAQAQERAETVFARRDANRDGTIDRADRQVRRGQMFERLDTDGNGAISRAEFDAMTAKLAADRTERAHAGKQRMARMAARAERAAGPMTRQAFVDRALTRFDRADADRDGTVTPGERKALRESMRGQWRARAAERQQG